MRLRNPVRGADWRDVTFAVEELDPATVGVAIRDHALLHKRVGERVDAGQICCEGSIEMVASR